MSRKRITKPDGYEEKVVFVDVAGGSPKKYFNRRRVKRRAMVEKTREDFEPITAEWFRVIFEELPLARHRKRLSQQALARLLGTTQSAVSRLETGKANPTVELLERLFIILDLEIIISVASK